MIVSILSAGPSLTETWQPDGTTTVAINRAINRAEADHLVAGDIRTVDEVTGRPRLALWTMAATIRAMKTDWPGIERHDFMTLPGCTDLPSPFTWSIQAGIAVACHLGASLVRIYGHDMTCQPDCSGSNEMHTPARWKREAVSVQHSIAWAATQGTTVERVTP